MRTVDDPESGSRTRLQPGFAPRRHISHVIFDFDGTLSWLRHGWPGMMVEVFRRHMEPGKGESEETLNAILLDDVLSTNGKPSIHQMLMAADRSVERGQPRPDPELMLAEYQELLESAILDRSRQIAGGAAARDDFLVHGARGLLDKLSDRGLTLIVLSGTPEPRVKQEAALLGLDGYFGRHIYGGRGDLLRFAKKDVMDRLQREEKIGGHALLSFGDGPVEISATKEAGGLAVGVASDEEVNGSGKMDSRKLTVLSKAGADMMIPDYREPDVLMSKLLDH